VVPYLQRISKGSLARQFKRRALKSKALLRAAITGAQAVAELDAALAAHSENMGGIEVLFSIPFPELGEIKTLRAAMQLWLDLEVELTRLLAEHAAAKGGAAQDALDDAIEVAVLRAEGIKDVRCSPKQWQLYEQARAPWAPRPLSPAPPRFLIHAAGRPS
jgi:hypothetical protein